MNTSRTNRRISRVVYVDSLIANSPNGRISRSLCVAPREIRVPGPFATFMLVAACLKTFVYQAWDSSWADLVEQLRTEAEAQAEIVLVRDGAQPHYDLRVLPLADQRSRPSGQVMTMRNIAKRKRAELEIRHS